MASVQCRTCGQGIHYHGEPNGIEFVLIKESDWELVEKSCFDKCHKNMDDAVGYPKLFRTDTIDEDFPGIVIRFWKCPNCGTLIFFDGDGRVEHIAVPTEQDSVERGLTKGYCANDYLWDVITESAAPNRELIHWQRRMSQVWISESMLFLLDSETGKKQVYIIK